MLPSPICSVHGWPSPATWTLGRITAVTHAADKRASPAVKFQHLLIGFLQQFHLTMAARLRSLIPRAHAAFLRQFNSRPLCSKCEPKINLSVNTYSLSEAANSHGIDLNFTPKQLNTLHSIAQHWQPEDAWCDGQALKLTQQDALSAYLVTLQNRCLSEPIHTLVNLTEVRSVDRYYGS
jgi:hypothetical protein